MKVPVISGLGLEGSYSHAFGLSSQDTSGNSVGTSWQAYEFGVRDRISIGDSLLLGVGAGYGDNSFSFDNAVTATEQLPSVDYQYVRAGVDGRYSLGDLSVRAAFGYRGVLSTGQVGKLFSARERGRRRRLARSVAHDGPRHRAFARPAVRPLLLQPSPPQPGDAYVAGGALDEMASLSLGLTYLL